MFQKVSRYSISRIIIHYSDSVFFCFSIWMLKNGRFQTRFVTQCDTRKPSHSSLKVTHSHSKSYSHSLAVRQYDCTEGIKVICVHEICCMRRHQSEMCKRKREREKERERVRPSPVTVFYQSSLRVLSGFPLKVLSGFFQRSLKVLSKSDTTFSHMVISKFFPNTRTRQTIYKTKQLKYHHTLGPNLIVKIMNTHVSQSVSLTRTCFQSIYRKTVTHLHCFPHRI
jgi:hypothetical protein